MSRSSKPDPLDKVFHRLDLRRGGNGCSAHAALCAGLTALVHARLAHPGLRPGLLCDRAFGPEVCDRAFGPEVKERPQVSLDRMLGWAGRGSRFARGVADALCAGLTALVHVRLAHPGLRPGLLCDRAFGPGGGASHFCPAPPRQKQGAERILRRGCGAEVARSTARKSSASSSLPSSS
jgi:hypothetical protein